MSATTCCNIFEKEITSRLLRPHKRANNKLTPTEIDCLTSAFNKTWGLLGQPWKEIEEELVSMPLKELFCIYQVVIFLFADVDEDDMRKIACEEAPWDSSEYTAILEDMLAVSTRRLERDLKSWYAVPDGAPLNIFAFFDHWQAEYMEQFG
ncbi:hypothetical protein CC86DRAFT_372135 [Ophiobolus disseminans]|uniref:Uncharacterized protein n=1 Tax=Ophiobolus disseminans TaxID=1469910 RepID=A0A6A6ZUH4_9PLEO|nr:hypothetical protein CC86DRAFT_372135 [Ophiobolus disseminans]